MEHQKKKRSYNKRNKLSPDERKCLVCDDVALACNFGAFTCESCKAFFRRNAHKSKLLEDCANNCVVTTETRGHCKNCRLQKCYAVGMNKDMIWSHEEKLERRKIIKTKKAKLATVSTSTASVPDSSSEDDRDNSLSSFQDAFIKSIIETVKSDKRNSKYAKLPGLFGNKSNDGKNVTKHVQDNLRITRITPISKGGGVSCESDQEKNDCTKHFELQNTNQTSACIDRNVAQPGMCRSSSSLLELKRNEDELHCKTQGLSVITNTENCITSQESKSVENQTHISGIYSSSSTTTSPVTINSEYTSAQFKSPAAESSNGDYDSSAGFLWSESKANGSPIGKLDISSPESAENNLFDLLQYERFYQPNWTEIPIQHSNNNDINIHTFTSELTWQLMENIKSTDQMQFQVESLEDAYVDTVVYREEPTSTIGSANTHESNARAIENDTDISHNIEPNVLLVSENQISFQAQDNTHDLLLLAMPDTSESVTPDNQVSFQAQDNTHDLLLLTPPDTNESNEAATSNNCDDESYKACTFDVMYSSSISDHVWNEIDPNYILPLSELANAFSLSFDKIMVQKVVVDSGELADAFNQFEYSVKRTVILARNLKGFCVLPREDQLVLLKGSFIEMTSIQLFKLISLDERCIIMKHKSAENISQVVISKCYPSKKIKESDVFSQFHDIAQEYKRATKNDLVISMCVMAHLLFQQRSDYSYCSKDKIQFYSDLYITILKKYTSVMYRNTEMSCDKVMELIPQVIEISKTMEAVLSHANHSNLTPIVMQCFEYRHMDKNVK